MKTIEIHICPGHCGPFAQPEHAHELVERLAARGWPVAYADNMEGLEWRFGSDEEYTAFSVDFEIEVDDMTSGRPLYWIVDFPEDG